MIYRNIDFMNERTCCGCGACYQICPKQCIKLQENERGFLVPVVNSDMCINCGMCIKICPELNEIERHNIINSYAAIALDREILFRSTSGGVFSVLCEYVLSNLGVVYGCAWGEDLLPCHIRVSNIEKLSLVQKSKYVQSNIGTSYQDAKKDLENGLYVLFSGTACQIAGLLSFLGKNYDKLITVEVACHGVPSPGLFKKYISWQEGKKSLKIISFQFRTKHQHKKGEHYKFEITYENGDVQSFNSLKDPFYGGFLEGKTLRKICYKCKYKTEKRIADFLLADYWGIEKEHPHFNSKYGASALIITSEKGQNIFNILKDKFVFEQSTFDKIVKHNESLIKSAKCISKELYSSLNCTDESLFKKLKPQFSLKKDIKYLIPEDIKYLVKKIF